MTTELKPPSDEELLAKLKTELVKRQAELDSPNRRSKKRVLVIERTEEWRRRHSREGEREYRAESGLTWREENYCLHFIQHGDPIKAFVNSGYTIPENGHNGDILYRHALRVLRRASVKRRLKELNDEAVTNAIKNSKITTDDIVRELMEILAAAKNESEFMAANKSAELLGKHLGMFVEKSEQKVSYQNLSAGESSEDLIDDLSKLTRVVDHVKKEDDGA